jgi:hypothetical protein
LYDAKGETRRVNCGDFTDQKPILNGCRFWIIPAKRRDFEQCLKRKQWRDIAGVPEAKPTELNTIG